MTFSRYEQAGVSIDAQDEAIHRIKAHVKRTETPRVLSGIGSFGGMFDISFPEMKQPVLVSSTDGIGTKLKIAFMTDRHDTVGQCLVNHCIDDILVQGAMPLFFMDYIATGKLKPHVVERILAGMAEACANGGLAILGGEMAEMPGFYSDGEYDVAGFIVGVVDREKILGAQNVRAGQSLLGLHSSGLHTNGYSLARKILLEEQGLGLDDLLPGTEQKLLDLLLAVHRPYHLLLKPLLDQNKIQAMGHITGGGFLDNLPRVLPPDVDAQIGLDRYVLPPLFRFLLEKGNLAREEAYRVFNMGIGMILIVNPTDEADVISQLEAQGEKVVRLGATVEGCGKVQLLEDSTR